MSMAGCGKKDTGESQKEFVYVPEYMEMNLECENIGPVVGVGDTLFIVGNSYDDDTQVQTNYMYKYNIMDQTREELSAELPQNSNVMQMTANQAGNILMIVNTYSDADTETTQNLIEIWEISATDGTIVNKQDITEIVNQDENAYV